MWSIGAVYSTVTLLLPDRSTPLECTMCSTGRISIPGGVGGGVVVVGGGGGTAILVVGLRFVGGYGSTEMVKI